jgi:hypothetical protein
LTRPSRGNLVILRGRTLQVEGEEAFEDLFVGEIVGSAAVVKHGIVALW